jgi:hypothetical protein
MKKISLVVLIFSGFALAQGTEQLLALLANTPNMPVKG